MRIPVLVTLALVLLPSTTWAGDPYRCGRAKGELADLVALTRMYRSQPLDIQISDSGDFAVVIARTPTRRSARGAMVDARGNWLNVWQRSDGRWTMLVEMFVTDTEGESEAPPALVPLESLRFWPPSARTAWWPGRWDSARGRLACGWRSARAARSSA